jgi:CPA2 family monovalent cation:H+ antiporter-2
MNWAPTVSIALVAALVFGTICRRLGLSPLLGYLVAGMAIGPHTPGFVGNSELAAQLADVGIVLLMFGVGLGFSFGDLWGVRRIAVPGALIASGVTVVLGFGIGQTLGWPVGGSAVFGMCLATASTVVIVRGMTELGLLAAAPGRIAVGWSLVEDLITVVLLVVLPAMAPAAADVAPMPIWLALVWSLGKVVVLAAVVVWGGGLVVPRLLGVVARAQSRELFTLAVLTLALGVAYLASTLFGVSLALGAFFAGMVVGRSDLSHQAAADALPMRDAFAVLFFVAVGMLFDPAYVWHNPLPVLLALVAVLLGKPLVGVAFMLWRGQPPRTALSVGAGVAQVSEFSFLLAGLATSLGILPEGGRDLVIAAALVSIAASPLLFRGVRPFDRLVSSWRIVGRLAARRGPGLAELRPELAGGLQDHVVVVGFGRVGSVLGNFLDARGVPFVVIELDRALVEDLRRRNVPALFGDASSPVLLDRARIAGARALVLTSPDAVAQRLAIEHARSVRADLPVLTRVHTQAAATSMSRLGGVRPVLGERELGLAMARQLLEMLGASTIEAEATVLGAARDGAVAGSGALPRLFEIVVGAGSPVVGRTLAEVGLPATVLVVAVVRGGAHEVPRGPTRIEAEDVLLLFASGDDARTVERCVQGRPPEAHAAELP